MDLLDTVISCDAIIIKQRASVIDKMINVLDDDREFGLTIGQLNTLKEYRERVFEIRRQYYELIKEVEQIAEKANKI